MHIYIAFCKTFGHCTRDVTLAWNKDNLKLSRHEIFYWKHSIDLNIYGTYYGQYLHAASSFGKWQKCDFLSEWDSKRTGLLNFTQLLLIGKLNQKAFEADFDKSLLTENGRVESVLGQENEAGPRNYWKFGYGLWTDGHHSVQQNKILIGGIS